MSRLVSDTEQQASEKNPVKEFFRCFWWKKQLPWLNDLTLNLVDFLSNIEVTINQPYFLTYVSSILGAYNGDRHLPINI